MFKPIHGGKKILIDGNDSCTPYECWLPPVGYGSHADTGEVVKTDVIKRSQIKSKQYWERQPLPADWEKQVEAEQRMKDIDPDYTDSELEDIRLREIRRIIYGVWFYNNGEPVYITGQHYMLLNYWKFQGKYFDYREPNRDYYYVLQYCIEDPNCLGLIEITKRKEGKTARSGLFLYHYIFRTEAMHGGIQSKTDGDAAEVFQKAVIAPWRKLPEFLRPIFDRSAGDSPSKELRLFNTSQKGRKKNTEDAALESFIDYKPAKPSAYDGPELHRYVSDEAGKLEGHSIADRHDVVMFCSEVDGKYIGKQLYTTTVEEMENGGAEFQKLVKNSNRDKRDKNGRTNSGLYTYFLPAYKTMYWDENGNVGFNKYGKPDEVKAREYFMNRRAALQNNTRNLASFIRKNPFTLDESFWIDGDQCLYDSGLLNEQLGIINIAENIIERGNFVWLNGEKDTKVIWVKDKHGHWEICWNFKNEGESNNISRIGNLFRPGNTHRFVAGADTFSHSVVKDSRRSDGAMFVKMKYDAASIDPYNDAFVCSYRHRAPSTDIQYEDMLKTSVFFGCLILFESNKNNWKDYFIHRGYEAFLMKLNGYDDYGIPGNQKTHQQLAEVTEGYILNSIKKVFFRTLINDWLQFDLNNTTAYDSAMAAGYTLIADNRLLYNKPQSPLISLEEYGFRKTAIS